MRILGVVSIVACVVAGACTPAGGSSDGAAVYDSVCSSCHGLTGRPTEQMIKQLNVRDLSAPAHRATLTPEYVAQQVRSGSTNKLMPSFQGALSNQQIEAVSAYVASDAFLKRTAP
ncbi:MAG: c-type cytochrome [Kofleriaceae bacterium]